MAEHFCSEHNCKFFENHKGDKSWYSHKQGDGWCNEAKAAPKPEVKPEPIAQEKAIPPVGDKPTPNEMTKADWEKKQATERASIERQVSAKIVFEHCDCLMPTQDIWSYLEMSENIYQWIHTGVIPVRVEKTHDTSQVEQGESVEAQVVAKPAKPATKGKSTEKVPDFKTAAELWNYALSHGYSIEGIKEKTGHTYPLEVIDLKATIKALYPA